MVATHSTPTSVTGGPWTRPLPRPESVPAGDEHVEHLVDPVGGQIGEVIGVQMPRADWAS